jgi:hypothetical protein
MAKFITIGYGDREGYDRTDPSTAIPVLASSLRRATSAPNKARPPVWIFTTSRRITPPSGMTLERLIRRPALSGVPNLAGAGRRDGTSHSRPSK